MNTKKANSGRQRRAEFGRYLKDLRRRRNLTQVQVAREFGINLCEIEKGSRSASDKLLSKLAERYNVPLEQILERKYWPQLSLLTRIMRPTETVRDLLESLEAIDPEERKEITREIERYVAFLLLSRSTPIGQLVKEL